MAKWTTTNGVDKANGQPEREIITEMDFSEAITDPAERVAALRERFGDSWICYCVQEQTKVKISAAIRAKMQEVVKDEAGKPVKSDKGKVVIRPAAFTQADADALVTNFDFAAPDRAADDAEKLLRNIKKAAASGNTAALRDSAALLKELGITI